MIANRQQLRKASREASVLIQQISDYVRQNPRAERDGKVRFPRGFIKTAPAIRRNLRFIEDGNLRSNVSYALITHETLRWMVFHTDLYGQAREMMIKEAVCVLGNICESVTIYPKSHGLGRKAGYAGRIRRLRDMGWIDDECVELHDWLWSKRNHEHLIDVPFREWSHYTDQDWYKSVKAYRQLRDGLLRWKGYEPVDVEDVF